MEKPCLLAGTNDALLDFLGDVRNCSGRAFQKVAKVHWGAAIFENTPVGGDATVRNPKLNPE